MTQGALTRRWSTYLLVFCGLFSFIAIAIFLTKSGAASLPPGYFLQVMNKSTMFARREKRNIAIMVVVDTRKTAEDYSIARQSLDCYAKLHGYHLLRIYVNENKTLLRLCPHQDFMFTRHCVAAQFIQQYDWTLFLDGDIGVINPAHKIEEYIDDSVNVIFYDRFYDNEVMAGSYLIRGNNYSVNFLHTWANFERRLPNSFHGRDNGVLHIVLLEELLSSSNGEEKLCEKLMTSSRSLDDLFTYIVCARVTLGANRHFEGKLKIIPKGQAWARDGWLTGTQYCERDFMFHGWKNYKLIGPKNEWTMPFRNAENFRTCTNASAFATKDGFFVPCSATDAKLRNWRLKTTRDFWESAAKIAEKIEKTNMVTFSAK